MDRGEVVEIMATVRAARPASEVREDLLAARAVALARHIGRPSAGRGWTQHIVSQTGLAWDTVERCMVGAGSDASYDTLAEYCGLTLAALDREAEEIVAVAERRKRGAWG